MVRERIFACDKVTMEVVDILNYRTEVCEKYGIIPSTLRYHLRAKGVFPGRYVFRNESDYSENESFFGKKHRPLVAVDKDGNETFFCDISEACYMLHATRNNIEQAIRNGHRVNREYEMDWAR